MNKLAPLFLTLALLTPAHAWTIEFKTGTSSHTPNTITINQDNHPPLQHNGARYETRPWETTTNWTEWYYNIRIGYDQQLTPTRTLTYELELLHDKAYLLNTTPEIRHFELSDGLNSLLLNIAIEDHINDHFSIVLRAGAGPSITAPATIINGLQLGTKEPDNPNPHFDLAGVSTQLATQLRYYLTPNFALTGEVKLTHVRTTNTIHSGTATAHFTTGHIQFGTLIRF